MTDQPRAILHVDMDAFFVSVEMRRHPELVGQPVVVGGAGPRGVVAAANYEARRFGVFSAMSSSKARRLCPHAVFLPGDHAHYSEVSHDVHRVFADYTPYVEPLGLDEAFLDVSGSRRILGAAVDIGWSIKNRIRDELSLDCAVGVAASEFVAKLASKRAKPVIGSTGVTPGIGVLEIEPGAELGFLHPLPVQALWGVGPATFSRLERLGVRTVGDLVLLGRDALEAAVGRAHGRHLFALASAEDERAVESDREVKSIGHEETFSHDLVDRSAIRAEVVRLSDAVAARLRARGAAARTITLKVRYSTFETITRSTTPGGALVTGPAIVAAIEPMLDTIDPAVGVRLIGVSGTRLVEPVEQLSLLDLIPGEQGAGTPSSSEVDRVWTPASQAVDRIRWKFGRDAIGPASGMRRGRPGTKPWG